MGEKRADVGIAPADQLIGLAAGRRAAGTGVDDRKVGTVHIVIDGDLAGGAVHQHIGD